MIAQFGGTRSNMLQYQFSSRSSTDNIYNVCFSPSPKKPQSWPAKVHVSRGSVAISLSLASFGVRLAFLISLRMGLVVGPRFRIVCPACSFCVSAAAQFCLLVFQHFPIVQRAVITKCL